MNDLTAGLAKELSEIANHVLLHEFNLFRSQGATRLLTAYARLSQSSDTKVYNDFVRSITSDGGISLYRRYPELRKLLALRIAYWLRSSYGMIKAFHADAADLETVLDTPVTASISHISCGLSDSHHKGLSVAIITLSSGKQIVYKPRQQGLEKAFMRVLTFLNSLSEVPLFRVMRLISRPRHGWSEYISHTQTDDPEALKEYFRRVGYLLAALHVFRATDCHFENLIASDGFPVMVDLETLGHPTHEWDVANREDLTDLVELYTSVSRVGLLPVIRTTGDELDLSALGAALSPQHILMAHFESPGTNVMDIKQVNRIIQADEVLPARMSSDRETLVDHLVEGFSRVYALLFQFRGELLGREDLVPSFKGTSCRYVARPTRLYGWLIQRCLDYSTLREEKKRQEELSRVYRAGKRLGASPHWLAVAEVESLSLLRNDIPHFHTPMDSMDLWSGRRLVARGAFSASPLELIRDRLLSLSDADCALQSRIIRLSFAQRFYTEQGSANRNLPSSPSPFSVSRLVRSAEDIAEKIIAVRQISPKGVPVWLGLGTTQQYGVYRLQPCGAGLYQGTAGVAVFLSALYSVTKDTRYRDLAMEILHPLGAAVERSPGLTLNLGEGLAGQAYAQMLAARFTNDTDLFNRAETALVSIPTTSVDALASSDVMAGLAGLCLVFDLALQMRPNPAIEVLLRYTASKLVSRQESTGPSSAGWRTVDDQSLAGFAHGSAGIALALSRAGMRLNERRLLAAAADGFRESERLYSHDESNWIDMRKQAFGSPLPCSWCHGAIGIGLASISAEGQHSLDGALIRARVRHVVDSWASRSIELDSLCCGAAGVTEWLLQDRDNPDQSRLVASCVDYLLTVPFYRNLPDNSSKVLLSGLFLGSAGVGYQLLRLAYPDRIPSLLTLQ